MINLWEFEDFRQCRSDFYRTSYDEINDVHLSDSKYDEVVNLDAVKLRFNALK